MTEIEDIAASAGLSPLVLALVLAPLATELPEKANSILWTRRGRDALAIGNITGALVFQSMPIAAVGLAFTTWELTTPSVLAIVCAVLGIWLALAAILRKRRFALPAMLGWGGLYLAFVGYVTAFARVAGIFGHAPGDGGCIHVSRHHPFVRVSAPGWWALPRHEEA